MTYVVTYIDVQPDETGQQAIALLKEYRQASRAEDGNSGVTVLQEMNRSGRFVIIEGWHEPSFHIHEAAAHTARLRSGLQAIQTSPYDQRVHHAFAVGPEPVTKIDVFVVVTHVDVPPPRKDETEVLLRSVAEKSRKDAGNVRYDVFQQNAPRLNHFTVFAAWNDAHAFTSNQMTQHTRQFRDALGPMLGAPYDERLYGPLD
jgi:quinol monooxygenase YgiN